MLVSLWWNNNNNSINLFSEKQFLPIAFEVQHSFDANSISQIAKTCLYVYLIY